MTDCDNQRPCPCTYDCPRHGNCCACVAHHRDNNEGVPGAFFLRRRKLHMTGVSKLCAGTEGSCQTKGEENGF